jgi:cellulose synthase/poly-beta-1,6-N-acetylglucosamine synthase-like glycosyltransferase
MRASRPQRTARALFWASTGLLAYTQLGYGLLLLALDRGRRPATPVAPGDPAPTSVSLIIAAHDEEAVIAEKVANARAQDVDCELIVACDGCEDATAQRAREAGADIVLELPRGGKIRAQDAGVAHANADVVAFSDANARWEPDALRALLSAFADPRVGYACGQVQLVQAASGGEATNQEGLYWRYEIALRALESRLCSITAGNGAIYATRREAYLVVDPVMGHDLSFPFNMVKRGWRAVYVPQARSVEKMVPSIEGEFARKRRMMSHTWAIVLRGGMLSLRGYPPLYALMLFSHRILRYASPALHLVAFAACARVGWARAGRAGVGRAGVSFYRGALAAQLSLPAAAVLARRVRSRPLLLARYYVLTTASVAAGLWDDLHHGTEATWEAAEGTR